MTSGTKTIVGPEWTVGTLHYLRIYSVWALGGAGAVILAGLVVALAATA